MSHLISCIRMGLIKFLVKRYNFQATKLVLLICIALFVDNVNSSGDKDDFSNKKLNKAFCTPNSEDNFSQCSDESQSSVIDRSITIKDSLDTIWCSIDKDNSDYITEDELSDYIKETSEVSIDDAMVLSLTKSYLQYLDGNLDGVICKYELRFAIHHVTNLYPGESLREYGQTFINWIERFVGESPRKYQLYLVKLFQMFDEDINGKLTWKEIKMVIKMSEDFIGISESKQLDEEAKEILLAKIKTNENKWVELEEFSKLLTSLEVNADIVFYNWLAEYLEGNSEYAGALESTKKDFTNYDANLDGIITKGEIIAALHSHRKDYYTDERINRRFTRSDRNTDGIISFNEYAFLENLKHPSRK